MLLAFSTIPWEIPPSHPYYPDIFNYFMIIPYSSMPLFVGIFFIPSFFGFNKHCCKKHLSTNFPMYAGGFGSWDRFPGCTTGER
jgi:hypothetical protein